MQGHDIYLSLLIIVLCFKLSKQIIQSSGPRSWPWLESSTEAHRHQDAHSLKKNSDESRASIRHLYRHSPSVLMMQFQSRHYLTKIFRVLAAWANWRSKLSACWFCGKWTLLGRLWAFTREYHFAACLVWESACGTGEESTSFRFPTLVYFV
jgi:hypothetical protein